MSLKKFTLLKSSIVLVVSLLFLCSCSLQKNIETVETKSIGTEKSIGLYDNLKSNIPERIAILDVAPSKLSKGKFDNLYSYGYKQSTKKSHSDYILSVINRYIPKNIYVDMYCIGVDDIDTDKLIQALNDIVERKYMIINMSFVLPVYNDEITNLLSRVSSDTLLVSSAGNHNLPYSEFPGTLPFVISVGGITDGGGLWKYSNFKNIDFVMPVNTGLTLQNRSIPEGTSISASYMTVYLSQLLTINDELLNKGRIEVMKKIKDSSYGGDVNKIIGTGQPVLKEDEK